MPVPETIVVVSDTQIPYEDRKAMKAVIGFIGDYQPDEVIHIGDLADFPQPSRWTKGTRAEFEGSVFQDAEAVKARFLGPLREVFDGPVGIHEGNHDERPRVYLDKYAPALSGQHTFDMDVLLDFDGFGVSVLPEFYDVAPNWVTTHGHRGGIRLNQTSGITALNAAKRFGKSVVMGHTHRLGYSSHTTGYDGASTVVSGVEVGNLMDMKQAGYLKSGTGNWQTGFAVLKVDGKHVQPTLVPISNRRFTVDGFTWEV
ncbi:metallophosphoesterase [Rhodococcus phage BobbyDazzler]|nr:metallophosphoesterase [Rhodococcus phage BobbyDazzler]